MQGFGGEPEGEIPLERYSCRWDDNATVGFEVGVMHRLYPSSSG
jgi:hypothetical protein